MKKFLLKKSFFLILSFTVLVLIPIWGMCSINDINQKSEKIKIECKKKGYDFTSFVIVKGEICSNKKIDIK